VHSNACTIKFGIISFSDPLHPRGLRCPLILHCGHSACENCIRISLHNSDRVVCGICKCTSTAAHQNTDVRLDFPLNIYLLGVFASQHWDQEPEDSKVTFVPAGITSSNWKAPVSKEMQQNHKLGELSVRSIAHQWLRKTSLFCIYTYSFSALILDCIGNLPDHVLF